MNNKKKKQPGAIASLLKQMIPTCMKTYARNSIWQYRRATWRGRSLPDFIIIGAQKSGTSSMFYYLNQHPQICPAIGKELHYFDGGLDPQIDNFAYGESWYRSHFPLKINMGHYKKTYEASPLYIFNPYAPKRIFDLLPRVKIIAVLRNPTERAISHYFHEKRKFLEPLSIFEALQKEEERLDPVIKSKDYKHYNFIHYSYKSRGLYKDQVERYLKYFSSEQLLIISSEKLFTDTANILKRTFAFIGVDEGFTVNDLKPCNVSSNKSDVPPDVYEYLNNYFIPHNQAFYEIVGENYYW